MRIIISDLKTKQRYSTRRRELTKKEFVEERKIKYEHGSGSEEGDESSEHESDEDYDESNESLKLHLHVV